MTRDDVRPARLADAVAERLEQLILEGVLRPGERLLPERDLAEKLNVSRPSLREALQKLEEKGLLRTSREGTVVAQLVGASLTDPLTQLLQSHPETTFDYLEFRAGVEGMAAYLAAQRATDVDRQMMKDCIERMQAAHGEEDSSTEADADTDLHLAIYEASHNVVLLHIMRGLAAMLRQDVFYNRPRLYSQPGVRELLLDQHRAICEAVMRGDADEARVAAECHINFTHKTMREIRDAEARLEVSLRRLGRSDLVAPAGKR